MKEVIEGVHILKALTTTNQRIKNSITRFSWT